MIITHYGKDGGIKRTAEGYGGNQCRKATAPYLVRQSGRLVKDEPTVEADGEAVEPVKQDQKPKLEARG